jgi:uncharacterized protein YqhQ
MYTFDSKTLATFAQQVSSKSAVNPTLWACVVISLPLFVLSTWISSWLSIAFFVVGLVPVILFLGSYIYMLCKNPNLLRSEEFHLRADAIALFGDKDNMLEADAAHVVAVITNPALPSPNEQKKLS